MTNSFAALPSVPMLLAAFESGRAQELEQGALRYLEHQPDDGLVRSLLAASLQMQGRVAEAAEVHAELTRRQPNEAAHWNNLGNALRELRQLDQAQAAYLRARALDAADPTTHHNLGLLALDRVDYPAAREHLLDAHECDPDAALVRIHAAQACHECGDFKREQALIAPWRQWPPLDEEDTLELAWLLAQNGHTDDACQMLRDLSGRVPHPERSWARLVLMLERVNRLSEARELLHRLPAVDDIEDQTTRQDVLNAQAVMAMRDGDWQQGRHLLQLLLAVPDDKRKLSNLYFALARACDRLKLPDQAMQACAQAHTAQVASVAALVPELMAPDARPLPLANARWSVENCAKTKPLSGPSSASSPIFVVGFPRSGTTLLEQMLDAHPQLCSMDERPFLQELAERLEQQGLAWPDGLAALDEAACADLREEYWRRVHDVTAHTPDQRLVDKNPLNLLRLPLIYWLFPNAKVILALRHPCDVLLSCYMQAFRSPAFAVLCSDLGKLAQGYDDAMRCWLYNVQLLNVSTLELRYEDLVTDTRAQVTRLGAFLELESPEQLLDFQQHAQAKGFISTPSYSQVVEGINRRGLNRWLPYRTHFSQVLPILQPHLDRWDYRA